MVLKIGLKTVLSESDEDDDVITETMERINN